MADPNSVINAVNTIPIFYKGEEVNRIDLAFCFRSVKVEGRHTHEKYRYVLRTWNDKKRIKQRVLSDCYAYEHVDSLLVSLMHRYSRHFYLRGDVEDYFMDKKEAKRNMAMLSKMMYVNNKVMKGNVLITSVDEIEEMVPKVMQNQKQGFKIIKVSDKILSRDRIIIAARTHMAYDSPLQICPLIGIDHFREFAIPRGMYRLNVDEKECAFPFIEKYSKIFKIYEEYINTHRPYAWYANWYAPAIMRNYFTTLRFLPLKKTRDKIQYAMKRLPEYAKG